MARPLELEGAPTTTDAAAGVRASSCALVAALFVRADGPYAGRSDVDAWTVDRDARTYPGPWPVVAHPPCARWGRLWAMHGRKFGDDGGRFASALAAVRRFGGVLEHPEGSGAWRVFGLPVPSHGAGWTRRLFDPGWSCSVDQSIYGHRARKRTWLYYVGEVPPALDWSDGSSLATAVVTTSKREPGRPPLLSVRAAELTPSRFAVLLLDLARGSVR